MVDEEEQRARQRSLSGLARELRVPRTNNPADPSRGGSRDYELYLRTRIVECAMDVGVGAAASRYQVAERTIFRWLQRLEPYRQTGNRARQDLTGFHQLLMSICYFIWPSATPDNVRAFIYTATEGERLYSREAIVKRANELDLKRKRGSTEAYQAFLPHNVLRCRQFWFLPPPLGIRTIRRRQFIDVDEFGMELSRCNDKYGRSHSSLRVRKPGHYSRTTKVTVLLAVEAGDPDVPDQFLGSVAKPRVWHRIFYQGGISQVDFAEFIDFICTNFEEHPAPNGCDDHRVFLWDNLAAHLTTLVYETVESRESQNTFYIVPRPPYQPKYGPSEYAICETVQKVQRSVRSDWTTETMVDSIREVLTTGFGWHGAGRRRFHHCGYTYDG